MNACSDRTNSGRHFGWSRSVEALASETRQSSSATTLKKISTTLSWRDDSLHSIEPFLPVLVELRHEVAEEIPFCRVLSLPCFLELSNDGQGLRSVIPVVCLRGMSTYSSQSNPAYLCACLLRPSRRYRNTSWDLKLIDLFTALSAVPVLEILGPISNVSKSTFRSSFCLPESTFCLLQEILQHVLDSLNLRICLVVISVRASGRQDGKRLLA